MCLLIGHSSTANYQEVLELYLSSVCCLSHWTQIIEENWRFPEDSAAKESESNSVHSSKWPTLDSKVAKMYSFTKIWHHLSLANNNVQNLQLAASHV